MAANVNKRAVFELFASIKNHLHDHSSQIFDVEPPLCPFGTENDFYVSGGCHDNKIITLELENYNKIKVNFLSFFS